MKGLPDIKVRDYSRKEPEDTNGLGSLTAVNVAAVKKAQEQLAVRVVKTKAKKDAQSSDDEGEDEEIFILGRMNTRSQTRVSRYYTHAEITADIEEARVAVEFKDDQ